jgi:phosphatidylserine/phosphatidylglycerophosphate/cardiolipin synthase-like enzyme
MYLLHGAGVPLIDDTSDGSKGSGTMHHKFMVVDERWVVFGSANFTMSGVHGDFANPMTRGNTNHLVLIDNKELARVFTAEFETLWGDGPQGMPDSKFGKKKPHRLPHHATVDGCRITVQFSPAPKRIPFEATANGLISRVVGGATRSVDMALFVFSSQEIVDALERAAMNYPSLHIRGIFDAGFATRYYSETLDMWQMALKDRGRYEVSSETGAPNRPWSMARGLLGIAVLAEGDKMHHKFAVVDSEIVITGSQNWSPTANSLNDEAVVILESETLAGHFLREMQRLSRSLHVGPTKRLLERVKERGGMFPPDAGVGESRSQGAAPTPVRGR